MSRGEGMLTDRGAFCAVTVAAHRPFGQGQVRRRGTGGRGQDLVGEESPPGSRGLRAAARRRAGLPRRPGSVRPGCLRRGGSGVSGAGPVRDTQRLARALRAEHVHPGDAGRAGPVPRRVHGPARSGFPGRPHPPRHARRHLHRHPLRQEAGPHRRHAVRRRDEEIHLHRAELPAAGPRSAADALFRERGPGRRHRRLLRALGHRQDHAVRRPDPPAHRRRRARLERSRHLQLRGRLLRQGDPAPARHRAGDLRGHPEVRHGAGECGDRPDQSSSGLRRRPPHREHPRLLSH